MQSLRRRVMTARIAASAVRYREPARRFYQKKKAKRNGTAAIKSVAHKLARACYYVLKDKEAFCVERCFS